MGAWEADVFSNDDARDFLEEIGDLSGDAATEKLRNALKAAVADDYLELPAASNTLVAAVIFAAKLTPDLATMPDPSVLKIIALATPSDGDQKLAVAAINRVFDSKDNEWYELWEESGELKTLTASLAPYKVALETSNQSSSKPPSMPVAKKSLFGFLKKKY